MEDAKHPDLEEWYGTPPSSFSTSSKKVSHLRMAVPAKTRLDSDIASLLWRCPIGTVNLLLMIICIFWVVWPINFVFCCWNSWLVRSKGDPDKN